MVDECYAKLKLLLADAHTPWQTVTIQAYGGQTYSIKIITHIALWYTCGETLVMGRAIWINDPTTQQVIAWFVARWNVEMTFEEVHAHLGFKTQRQWCLLAIQRSSPAMLGLFSFVTLLAHHLLNGRPLPTYSAAWYAKSQATFSDALAYVRRYLWEHTHFPRLSLYPYSGVIPESILCLWEDLLCYPA